VSGDRGGSPATAVARHLLELPESLRANGFRLRAEAEEDVLFLERLYLSVRWSELDPTGWTNEGKADFLRSQFSLQRRHYTTYYGDAQFAVVEHGSTPAGRLYLLRGPDDFRIIDISLLPEFRGQGVGTALLDAVIQEAERESRSVSIHVEKFNPAKRLYRRLGFREAGESGPYWLMIRPALALDESQ